MRGITGALVIGALVTILRANGEISSTIGNASNYATSHAPNHRLLKSSTGPMVRIVTVPETSSDIIPDGMMLGEIMRSMM